MRGGEELDARDRGGGAKRFGDGGFKRFEFTSWLIGMQRGGISLSAPSLGGGG